MRRSERKARERARNLPDKYKKADTSANNSHKAAEMMQAESEKVLFPLRINARTVIYVTKEKHTSEYAAEYKERMKLR